MSGLFDMADMISRYLAEIMIGIVAIVGAFAAVQTSLRRLVSDVQDLQIRVERKDTEHDACISELREKVAVLEAKQEHYEGWLKEIRDQVKGIYNSVVRGIN